MNAGNYEGEPMTNHRDEAGIQLSVALDDSESDPIGLGILHALLGIHDLLAVLQDDDLAGEEQHQSEKFEFSELFPRRELDEDNPDTLVGDAGLVDDADTIARPLSFGGILDTPRTDFYGTPGPWSAA